MERMCFVMTLRDGREQEYEQRHEEVWPELLGDLWTAGWRNYSLFRRGREVIGYAECHPDVRSALTAMEASAANARWAEWFTDVIETLTDESGQLQRLVQVWHLDETLAEASADPDRLTPR